MTDSENKEKWISIPYLPPPLGSLQDGGLKADNGQDPPLEVGWRGVEGVWEKKVSKVEPTHWSSAYPKPYKKRRY